MKPEICDDGHVHIIAENQTEIYALEHLTKEGTKHLPILVDYSLGCHSKPFDRNDRND